MTPPRILLTGFEHFGGEAVNPSGEVARTLDGWPCEGHLVRAVRLSCVFGSASRELDAAVAARRPALVVCLGQAGGRAEISIHLRSRNARKPSIWGAPRRSVKGRQVLHESIPEIHGSAGLVCYDAITLSSTQVTLQHMG